jgi:threonine dehydrogenase-like Zn-dependent dehydrogenase
VLQAPGQVSIETIAKPDVTDADILLKVSIVGFCGRDLNSFRGLDLLVSYPRIPGHEVSATVLQSDGTDSKLTVGSNAAVCRDSKCGKWHHLFEGAPNACQFTQTLGAQSDGAVTECIVMPRKKLYPAELTLEELCLLEPLTVGFLAVARGRVSVIDKVAIFGCGGVGLGAVVASSSRGSKNDLH